MDPREPAPRTPEAWPLVVFDAPVLRGLDARARREIADAGRLRDLAEGAVVYRAGDEGPSFFVVAAGSVAMAALRRGDDRESEIRVAKPGESFGEESTVGLTRRATASAKEPATIAEIPLSVFRRAIARKGTSDITARIERSLARSATSDLLRTLAVTRDLPVREIDVLLDTVTLKRFERGEHVVRQGEPANELFLVADGLVQIQVEDDERLRVLAFLARGDFFGDMEILAGTPRAASAVASGPTVLAAVPARVFREIASAHPGLLPSLRRLAEDQEAAQRAVVGKAAANATQHAFRDLYRLKIARSLLVIDLASCVRCGHCAWACAEVHGVARIVRRGDKMVVRTDDGDDGAPQHLMLPSSCQHCEHPACMVDCPTGAIGRDPSGEVFIREELCTGCGACARACPWDNIQMAPRPLGAAPPPGHDGGARAHGTGDLAVKCDLCRGHEGPACVGACPTGSIFRLNPAEEVADVREIFGGPAYASKQATNAIRAAAPMWVSGAAIAAIGVGFAGVVMQARGHIVAGRGVGLLAGVLAGLGMIALLAYAIPKRGVKRWMKRRADTTKAEKATSVVRPQLRVHLALGLLTAGLALAHAPLAGRAGSGTALLWALAITSFAGGFAGIAYRVVPPRLARIERAAALPEDFSRARRELHDRLYREASGKSDLVKRILEKILLPYARSPQSIILSF